MLKVEEIVTDVELDKAYGNAHFGSMTKRDVIRFGVLKCAAGYYQGYTSKTICMELGLLGLPSYTLTEKGRQYLWAAFSENSNF